MKEERTLYIFMNKNFEFTDEEGNITEELREAFGFPSLARAREERETFDEPEEWKIVTKKITLELGEIIDE